MASVTQPETCPAALRDGHQPPGEPRRVRDVREAPLPAQTSTVACGATFPIQAAVSGDSSEPRISR